MTGDAELLSRMGLCLFALCVLTGTAMLLYGIASLLVEGISHLFRRLK